VPPGRVCCGARRPPGLGRPCQKSSATALAGGRGRAAGHPRNAPQVKADITPAALEERALVQAFGARVRTSRIEQGLPQTELAALANVTVSWITRIEQGRHRTNVSLAMIQRLARALEMTYDELLDGLPVVSQRHSRANRRVPLIPPKTDPRPPRGKQYPGNWSYERTRGLVDMRNEGMTHAEIAEQLHVSVRAVEQQIGALVFRGVIPSRRELLASSTGVTNAGNAPAVERLYKRNWPLRRIAFVLDIGHSELQRVKTRLHEAGMPSPARAVTAAPPG
jgi:transcriptional regulator with XRE-family HTH domain